MTTSLKLFSILGIWFQSLLGCSSPVENRSEPLVTNGITVTSEYPAVVRIRQGSASCTATLVSPTTVITAAHCVDSGATATYGDGAFQCRVVMHPNYKSQNTTRNDLAILLCPPNTKINPMPLLGRSPQKGERFLIVGFGMNVCEDGNRTGSGTKRMGENIVDSAMNGEVEFHGATRGQGNGLEAASCSGDSGGPLFINGALAANTSRGSVSGGVKKSLYTDHGFGPNKEFLRLAIQNGAKIWTPEPAVNTQGPFAPRIPLQQPNALGQ